MSSNERSSEDRGAQPRVVQGGAVPQMIARPDGTHGAQPSLPTPPPAAPPRNRPGGASGEGNAR